ncbi:hypothetical protein BDV37DRAFT_260026 [Aspergillus pseudonomiae]|uniref:Uncharacterized protein n=1 Tax=Aspergillus pseudonomiae TaxID=1506151 RepID=A0A5N7CZM5_9EURO|nr:uncharacterized protein BDV37DRAFT_260026 [Aspergillus pseudonomiae]KAE8399620.1 hypothetical protein BDV37DRAFT_260026 [Aspergillus pseudonomiae]
MPMSCLLSTAGACSNCLKRCYRLHRYVNGWLPCLHSGITITLVCDMNDSNSKFISRKLCSDSFQLSNTCSTISLLDFISLNILPLTLLKL